MITDGSETHTHTITSRADRQRPADRFDLVERERGVNRDREDRYDPELFRIANDAKAERVQDRKNRIHPQLLSRTLRDRAVHRRRDLASSRLGISVGIVVLSYLVATVSPRSLATSRTALQR